MVYHLKYTSAFSFAVLLLFFSLSVQAQIIEAKDGILDLRKFPIEKQIAVLDGDWSFYWERLMNVQDFDTIRQQTFQKVPSMWRGAFWQGIRQYGGESKKKLSARLFKEMLFEVHNIPATTQGIALEEKFELWQGKEKQIDYVLLVGVRLS